MKLFVGSGGGSHFFIVNSGRRILNIYQKSFCFYCNKVLSLKDYIKKKIGLKVGSQELSLKGVVLEDSRYLISYDILNYEEVELKILPPESE